MDARSTNDADDWQRCREKGIACIPRKSSLRRRGEISVPAPEVEALREPAGELDIDIGITPASALGSPQHMYQRSLDLQNGSDSLCSPAGSASSILPVPRVGQCLSGNIENYQDVNAFPAFFEQVMMPPSNDFGEVQQPRGVFDFMCDPEYASQNEGLFGDDILMDLDKILEYNPSPVTTNSFAQIPTEEQNTKQRVAAFRKSLW